MSKVRDSVNRDLGDWKDRLIGTSTTEFCCFILLVHPGREIMQVFSVLPPDKSLGYRYIQIHSEYAPPLFSKVSAAAYGAELMERGWTVVVYCYEDGILRTMMSNLDEAYFESDPVPVSTTRSMTKTDKRNVEMLELRKSGVKVKEIAKQFKVSTAVVYQNTRRH